MIIRRQARNTIYIFCVTITIATIYIISTHRTFRIQHVKATGESEDYIQTKGQPQSEIQSSSLALPHMQIRSRSSTLHNSPINFVRLATKCQDRSKEPSIRERGNFLVYHNVIPASRDFLCHESVTLATQGDCTFLDNLEPLVERWKGPISVSLYAPGDDFQLTLNAIGYLRHCRSPLVKEFVTFHLFYERKHFPKKLGAKIYDIIAKYDEPYDCDVYSEPPYTSINRKDLYKTKNKLSYPINVARNIAVQESQTHFVLAADMELIPSVGIIDKFLAMVARNYDEIETTELLEMEVNKRQVYAFALMEVTADSKVPETKTKLQEMHHNHKAFFFAEKLCITCQGIPRRKTWMNSTETEDLHIFTTSKRKGEFERWEPVYIGTRTDPLFDERVTWEGTTNKMIQAYVMCLLDYDFHVLDNAFFVHRPGIKKKSSQTKKDKQAMAKLITNTVVPELQSLYGKRKGCVVGGEMTRKTGG